MKPNADVDVVVDGRKICVTFLDGMPWYVTTRLANGFHRTIWHRANSRPMGRMVQLAVSVARGESQASA